MSQSNFSDDILQVSHHPAIWSSTTQSLPLHYEVDLNKKYPLDDGLTISHNNNDVTNLHVPLPPLIQHLPVIDSIVP